MPWTSPFARMQPKHRVKICSARGKNNHQQRSTKTSQNTSTMSVCFSIPLCPSRQAAGSSSSTSSILSINSPETLLQYNGNHIEKHTKKMGNLGQNQRKPRFMCLHGFRTSAQIMKTQIGKWPESVLDQLDLVFVDAPFPCEGKSDVEGIFDPPYYEWFQFNKEFMEYRNFDECLTFIEDCMLKLGPFDGLLGFSQGAILSAALPGMQAKGLALTKVPKIKFLIIIGGAKFASPVVSGKAYSSQIEIPSLHFLGETDFLRQHGIKLIESFVDPCVIRHPKGHTVPRLDEKSLEIMNNFLEKIQKTLTSSDEISTAEEEKEESIL